MATRATKSTTTRKSVKPAPKAAGKSEASTAPADASAKSAAAKAAPARKAVANKAVARKAPPARKAAPAKKAPSSRSAPGRRPTAAAKAPSKSPVKQSARTPSGRGDSAKGKQAEADHVDRIWELAERIGICMFITWDGERQRARPLAAHVDRKEHAIYFLTDTDGHKDEQIAKFPTVSLAFADGRKNRYVAITGKASLSNDRGKIKDLWNPWAKAWWDSADDPKIRVIRVVPDDAELWDSPGRVATTAAMLSAVLTGKSPKLLDNAKVTI